MKSFTVDLKMDSELNSVSQNYHSSHLGAKFSFELQLVRVTDALWSDEQNSKTFLVLPLLLCTVKISTILQPLLAVMVNLVVVIKFIINQSI